MITLKNLEKIYRKPHQPVVKALDKVSLNIEAGEFVSILGPSGSGKTTLMNMMGLLDQPDSGSYSLNGVDMYAMNGKQLAAFRNKSIGFVFQSFHLLPRTTAIENVLLPLLYSKSRRFEDRSTAALQAVGLQDRANHYTHELSGGQQQRVAIARAIVNDPEIVFADEPTGNLDSESEAEVIDLFTKLNDQGRTIIFITHNLEIAKKSKRIINIRDGAIEMDQRVTS